MISINFGEFEYEATLLFIAHFKGYRHKHLLFFSVRLSDSYFNYKGIQ